MSKVDFAALACMAPLIVGGFLWVVSPWPFRKPLREAPGEFEIIHRRDWCSRCNCDIETGRPIPLFSYSVNPRPVPAAICGPCFWKPGPGARAVDRAWEINR
jgi:hypothetical protein